MTPPNGKNFSARWLKRVALFLTVFALGIGTGALLIDGDKREEPANVQAPGQMGESGKGEKFPSAPSTTQSDGEKRPERNSKPTLPEGHSPVTLTLKQEQLIGVQYGTAKRKSLVREIYASGSVAYDPELYTVQREYLEALKQVRRTKSSPLRVARESAKQMLQSAKLRLRILGLSDEQIAGLSQGRKSSEGLLLPKSGANSWIYAEIYEIDLPFVRAGMEARIAPGGIDRGKEIIGRIASIEPILDEKTRTATARISIRSGEVPLKGQSYVRVTIPAKLGIELSVPSYAVLDSGKKAWVFVTKEDGVFEPRVVEIKFRAGEDAAIASGLQEGERIVTSANFLLDSESRLQAAASAGGAPQCPSGERWDAAMAMCMPSGGGDEEAQTPKQQMGGQADPGQPSQTAPEQDKAPKTNCPEGKRWDASMKMCM